MKIPHDKGPFVTFDGGRGRPLPESGRWALGDG
jgi:hypothetical protein